MSIKSHVTGVQHLGLPTNDLAATIAFYESLGFEVAHRAVDEAAEAPVCFLKLGTVCVETYENHQATLRTGAFAHLALDVDDIEATRAAVLAAGYETVEADICFLPFWERGVRFFNITGPNGETVELCQRL